jgi:putative membrane-bound dehydrogenase-like protein
MFEKRDRLRRGRAFSFPPPPVNSPSRFLFLLAFCATIGAAAEYTPVDTQPIGQPLPPAEAATRFHLPPGFRITLAAAEPDVRQPIALTHDDRGRVWVAESYSYAGSKFIEESHDRILIFEDADGDGVFESRKIFAEGLSRLSGLTIGFGGVWVTTAPVLAFIPDRDGDDRPDGPPIVQLDGWTTEAEHNTVNGLTWGPDGWLYGRHGIKQSSLVGRPGAPAAERIQVGCAIWRFHPTRHRFEVVADGTINPWGLDFDEHGQAFISTSVIDHFWHIVPGVRLERWKGLGGHADPYTYELMTATSDHLHWGGGAWDRGGRYSGGNDALGGGHSHSDAMIYLGDRWPAEYRGSVFMSNIHGRRINRDTLVRQPSDGRYAATHAADFISVDDPWFRAISLQYGPDGDVVMSDWSDFGECHDRDGVHRSSGRLYKISWGQPRHVAVDLGRASIDELVALQTHANEWFVRHARRRLQELAAAGADLGTARQALRGQFDAGRTSAEKLRALWALHATGGADATWLITLLSSPDEHIRHWAIRLLVDDAPGAHVGPALTRAAAGESSWLVQMALASALGRFELPARLEIARPLLTALGSQADPNLVRLLWYGIQPGVPARPAELGRLALASRPRLLRHFIARRLAEEMNANPAAGGALVATLSDTHEPTLLLDLLEGANRGLAGRASVAGPAGATARLKDLMGSSFSTVRQAATLLAATFGESTALEALRHSLNDRASPDELRRSALEKLAMLRPAWLPGDLLDLLRSGQLVDAVLRTLPAMDDARVAATIITVFPQLPPALHPLAIEALVSRASSARTLLDAIAAGKIDRKAVSLNQARQIARFGNAALSTRLDEVWGGVTTPAAATAATITRLRLALSPAVLATADLRAGATLFEQRCALCHKLFGQGQSIGPDLTGSGRKDLEYLLLNIADPNASIPADYRLSIITLRDARVISGSIVAETPGSITVRTTDGESSVSRETIQGIERLPVSLMPGGLLDSLSPEEIRDLFGYLMSDGAPPPLKP